MAEPTPQKAESADVQPYEAKGLRPTLSERGGEVLSDLMTAVNGFYYPGDRSDAVSSTVAWLQAHPEACVALGLSLPPGMQTRGDGS